MEIRFCSVCNESIPDGEFDAGRAIVSGSKSQHVACALRRSVEQSGPRSWITLALALLGAAVGAYLLVVHLGETDAPPVLESVPAVVEDRIGEVVRDSEERLAALDVQGRNALRKDLTDNFEARLREWLDGSVGEALDKQDARLRDTSRQVHDRLTGLDQRLVKVQQQIELLLDWKQRIQDEAEELRRELEAVGNHKVPDPPKPAPPAQEPTPTPAPPTAPDEEREKEIDRWIKRLRDADEDIVFSATIELARLKALRATPDLVKVLRDHKDFYARLGAATALGEIQSADAVPDLIEALNDKDDLVRTAASEALHRITGQDFNFVSGLTKSERVRIQKKWRTWWRDNEEAVRARLGQPKSG